jgi:apolipoprotein N-acyltransferase
MRRSLSPRIALLTGILLPLTFAPLPFGFLAHFSLLPLFWGLHKQNPKTSFRWGFATGFLFYLGLLYWINFLKVEGVTVYLLPLGVLILISYLSLYIGVFALLLAFLQKRFGDLAYLFAPPLWTSLEFLRSLTYLGFPWENLAYSQTSYIPFIQFADITGIPGVTFWVVSVNTAFFILIRRIKGLSTLKSLLFPATSLMLLFVLPLLYGTWILRNSKKYPKINVAIAQLNVPPEIRRTHSQAIEERFAILRDVTLKVPRGKAHLMLWPETAVPGFPRLNSNIREQVESIAQESDIPILIGTADYLKGDYYNSAMLVDPQKGLSQTYSKILLVPFGERMPFDDIFPSLRKMELGQGQYSPGKEKIIFHLKSPSPPLIKGDKGEFSFSTLICFESIFPWFVRGFVKNGAQFLVNITDDSWFGRTSGPFQHAQMAVFRSIENRRALARCANTGVSMVVDPFGRIKKKTEIFTRGVFVEKLPLRTDLTFYTRFGDIFAWICVFIILLVQFGIKYRRK